MQYLELTLINTKQTNISTLFLVALLLLQVIMTSITLIFFNLIIGTKVDKP